MVERTHKHQGSGSVKIRLKQRYGSYRQPKDIRVSFTRRRIEEIEHQD